MFDPGRLFGRGWIPHGSPLWPSLATADPAKVTKYNFLVSCASANEYSWLIVGMEAYGVGLRPLPVPKLLILVNFPGFSGAGVAVYNVSSGFWALRSARGPSARPLGAGAAF